MNAFERVQQAFDEALTLEPEERTHWLRALASEQSELGREVEALLRADAEPRLEFERGAGELLLQLREEPDAEELCGTEFDGYRIEAHLSSGGMAHVYRATRTSEGAERRVALKVLRPRLNDADFMERFRRERRLLATLEHENIVTFLDAGSLPDGRPFLAMEFVEGQPLTEWARAVPLRRRLELFLQVLGALRHAHGKLILHRDLKPSNVLVTSAGVPKLLDFGVASVLDAGACSQDSGGPLTPSHASPEQQRGEPVTVATDIYSLGVLLHELVHDELPERRPTPEHARPTSDLDRIVRRSLAAAPSERYLSVDQIADDLARYLRHEPVQAFACSWSHRAVLFARRARWPLGIAAALVLALALGWAGALLERDLAEADASMGWGAHSEAKRVARLFEEFIAATAAGADEDPTLYLETALREDLGGLPEAETMVRLTLARLYLERGAPEQAAEHAERAYELAQVTIGIGYRERERAAALRDEVRAQLE